LAGIFVSYRRSDSQGEAGRLFDDLVKHFGEDMAFMDVTAIEAGRDFRKAIEEGITKCGVLLVVIGPEWVDAKDERGARRLNDPSDFVRIETAAALKRDIPVIPVLVRGARMPLAEQLPEDLKELAYRNCIELTHARWRSDIQLLTEALRRLLGDTTQAATSARATEATASTRPGVQRQEAISSSKLKDENSAQIDPAVLQRVTRELALHIGPIAGIVVKRAATQCNSVEDLCRKVAEEIDSQEERKKFLQERASVPTTPLPRGGEATSPASNTSGGARFSPPPARDDLPSKTVLPATASSSRWKYLLLASVGGLFVIVVLVLIIHFAPSGRAGSSPSAQTSAQEAHRAEFAPAQTGTLAKTDKPVQSLSTRETDESQRKSSQRVRVPPEVAKSLVISTVSPAYPVLAR
jgi:TIR domain